MLRPCVEQWETPKDYPLRTWMSSPIDVHKLGPGKTSQVLHHVCGTFQGIGQVPHLPSSCYASAEGGLDPPAPRRRSHRHGGHQPGRKNSVITLLIYPEDSGDKEDNLHESPSDPTYADPTLEIVHSSEKHTKEPTLKSGSDALSEPSAPTREGFMGDLDPGYIVIYHKGSDTPIFATLEELTNKASWGDTQKYGFWAKTRAWSQENTS